MLCNIFQGEGRTIYNELLIYRKEKNKIIVRKKGIGRIIYGYSLRLPFIYQFVIFTSPVRSV